jgi:hypothetical protein
VATSITTYSRMRTDAQIASLLLGYTLPIRRYRWYIDPNGARDEVVEDVANDFNLPIDGEDPKPTSRRRDQFSHDRHLFHALLMIVYLVAEASTASFHHPISDHALRVALLFAVVFAGSLPAFAILVAIMASFHSQVWSRFAAQLSAGKRIHEALRARGDMQRALAGLPSLVAGAVLATGAYRIAVLAHDPNSEIPTIQVLAYGAMFTAILAAVYIPSYMGWQDRVAELRDDLYPIPEPGIIRHDWMEDRSAFEALVHVNVTAGAAFKTAFAVFAPLAAALLTVVIPV